MNAVKRRNFSLTSQKLPQHLIDKSEKKITVSFFILSKANSDLISR
jgi:hypothetical protein